MDSYTLFTKTPPLRLFFFAALPGAVRVPVLLVLAVTVLVFACRLVGTDAASFYYAQF